MRQKNPLLFEILRLAFAAVLFLAAVASARLQGEIGAITLALGGHTTLCLNDSASPAPESESARRQHCVLCALPLADAPPVSFAVAARVAEVIEGIVLVAAALQSASVTASYARGPPAIG